MLYLKMKICYISVCMYVCVSAPPNAKGVKSSVCECVNVHEKKMKTVTPESATSGET